MRLAINMKSLEKLFDIIDKKTTLDSFLSIATPNPSPVSIISLKSSTSLLLTSHRKSTQMVDFI